MSFIEEIKKRAKDTNKTIVLPEYNDKRIIEAASICLKEDICKIYDLINGNGLLEEIVSTIPEEEYGTLWSGIKRSINALYDYKNSVLGILEQVSADYSALDYEATDIQKKIADPKNMELLRGVLSKLG